MLSPQYVERSLILQITEFKVDFWVVLDNFMRIFLHSCSETWSDTLSTKSSAVQCAPKKYRCLIKRDMQNKRKISIPRYIWLEKEQT